MRRRSRACSRRPTSCCCELSARRSRPGCASTTPTGSGTRPATSATSSELRSAPATAADVEPEPDATGCGGGLDPCEWRAGSGWWDAEWAAGEERERLRPLYVVVEKILGGASRCRPTGRSDGTTGYEFSTRTTGSSSTRRTRRLRSTLYQRFTGDGDRFADLVYEQEADDPAPGAGQRAQRARPGARPLSEHDRRSRDFTLNSLRDALREVIACFPVYRTYIDRQRGAVTQRDRRCDRARGPRRPSGATRASTVGLRLRPRRAAAGRAARS